MKRLLEVRKELKERKPVFIRQDNPKRMKLNYKWRKPKGIHSKIRHKFKGRRKMPSPGYKSPRKVKGLHHSGLKMIHVFSASDVSGIKKESEGIIMPKSVGMRKRLGILEKAKELNIMVLNINADEHMAKIKDFVSSKRKGQKAAKKEEVKELKEQKKQEKNPELSDEQKKEEEKKEKNRILTKKV